MRKQTFLAEVTDTFGGEANYCWVRRYIITAKSIKGAIWKLSREEGLSFKKDYDGKWDARGCCICAFVTDDDYAINECLDRAKHI